MGISIVGLITSNQREAISLRSTKRRNSLSDIKLSLAQWIIRPFIGLAYLMQSKPK